MKLGLKRITNGKQTRVGRRIEEQGSGDRRSAPLAIEGKGGVTIRIKDDESLTIDTLSTMKSRRKLLMKLSKAKVDAWCIDRLD